MGHCTATAKAEFDFWSQSYDYSPLQRFVFAPAHDLLLEQLRPADRKLLDVGCGTGVFADRVLRQFPAMDVCGIDLSARMIQQGAVRVRTHRDRYFVVQGDSQRLPFNEGTFDVVTCSHSFHHYPDQSRVMAEMFRVTRPGGRVMVIDGNRDGWWGWVIFDVLVTLTERAVHHCSARRFRALFHHAGFEPIQQIRRGRVLPFLLTQGEAKKVAIQEPIRKAA